MGSVNLTNEGYAFLIDLDKAISFVEGFADTVLLSRLRAILENGTPNERAIEKIEQMRKSDGGFAFWDDDVSSMTTTMNIVGWLDDLGLRRGLLVDRTFNFLADKQLDDGGWDELDGVRRLNPPIFMKPGELSTRTWLTACCAHWFIRFGRDEPSCASIHPTDFLKQYVLPSGLIKGYLYASWDALVVFKYRSGIEAEVFRKMLQAVQERFNPIEYDGADLAWLLRCLRDIGLTSADGLVSRAIDALEHMQQPDGSWTSGDGEGFKGMTTIDAIRVLHDFKALRAP